MNSGATSIFEYFADPHRFSTYVAAPQRCDVCGATKPGYADAFFSSPGGADVRFVCEDDLRSGALAALGATVNTADRLTLEDQILEHHPDWKAAQRDAFLLERTREVEVCTPSIVAWQEYEWPAHCADYMRYVREIGRADCERLGGGDGPGFLRQHLDPSYGAAQDDCDETVDDLWNRMRPVSPVSSREPTSTSFYLFQCRQCGRYLIDWDSDTSGATAVVDSAESQRAAGE